MSSGERKVDFDLASTVYTSEVIGIAIAMGKSGSIEKARQLFRREWHRAFDPEFFPAFLEVATLGFQPDMASNRSNSMDLPHLSQVPNLT